MELILKSPCGNYAEVLVTSDGDKPGKSNIVSGEYDGMLIDQSVATALTKLNHAFHEEELNRKEKRELDSKLKKQAQLT